jgi:NDP-mannose synthase
MTDKLPTAIILAAGEGSRLKPYTEVLPKALFPVGNKPCIRWIVDDLISQGFKEINICVNENESELFIHEFRELTGTIDSIVTFSSSQKPLGTCGEIKSYLKYSTAIWPILIIYADDLTYTDYHKMLETHIDAVEHGFIGTIGVTSKNKLEVGLLKDEYGKVIEFYEKPNVGQFGWTSWTGRALFQPDIMNYLREGEDIATNVFPLILDKLHTYKSDSEWLDIGNIAHYKRANEKAKNGQLW